MRWRGLGFENSLEAFAKATAACIDGISLADLSEPISIGLLRESRCSGVPEIAGIDLILRESGLRPGISEEKHGWSI